MSQYLDILKNAISNPHNLFILILGISFAFLLLFDLITTKKFPFIGSILFLIIISFSAIYAFKPTLIPSVIIDFLTKRYQTVKNGSYCLDGILFGDCGSMLCCKSIRN